MDGLNPQGRLSAQATRERLESGRIRADFPLLTQQVHGRELVYLDNAATTQKPEAVLQALDQYYRTSNANVHRGAHEIADRATRQFEAARESVRRFLNAAHSSEIIWTRGTTESINLVAQCFCQAEVKPGDEILVSGMEHHSNIVPWQLATERHGALLKVIPVTPSGELDMDAFSTLLGPRTRLVSVVHVSNALGTINPVAQIIRQAHAHGAKVLIDGAQAVGHWPIDVQALDCDFYAFSGHKLFGPTGIGVLYGKHALLAGLPPYQGGGEMIETVSFSGTRFNQPPYRFEAGTPNIAGAIGLAAAIQYLDSLDRGTLHEHETALIDRALELSWNFPGLIRVGMAAQRTAVFSFVLAGAHPHDVGTLLDQQGIAVRTGHHCAMPIMAQYHLPGGTVRASFSFYNRIEEVDRLFSGLTKVRDLLL